MNNSFIFSSQLFTPPSFAKGTARIGDLFGQDEYNYESSDEEADIKALERDWSIIGRDISQAMQTYDTANK